MSHAEPSATLEHHAGLAAGGRRRDTLRRCQSSAANHRYHTDDYFNVDPLLGGNAALRVSLDEAHGRDMRVILDGVFNHVGRGFWPFHHVLENGSQSPNAVQLNLLGSHDIPRLRTLVSSDLTSVQLAMLIQMTLPGAPCIYYGDEIGMDGAMDPDCRRAFPSDPGRWNDAPYGWLKALIAQRRSNRALRDGELRVLHASNDLLVYLRRDERDTFVIVVNAGTTPAIVDVALAWPVGSIETVGLGSGPADPLRAQPVDGGFHVRAPTRSGGLMRLTNGP